MFLYTILEAIFAIAAGIFIAVNTKKVSSVTYGKLDKAGRITNVLLILVYACFAPFYMFLGMISLPAHDGFLGIIGWIVAIINASAALFCALGLGFSVAWRKKGYSKLSFAVQFAGVVGIAWTVISYLVFEGNLLETLN